MCRQEYCDTVAHPSCGIISPVSVKYEIDRKKKKKGSLCVHSVPEEKLKLLLIYAKPLK